MMTLADNTPFTFPTLTRWKKQRFLNYAQHVLESQQHMQALDGKNIIHYALQNETTPIRMEHYPEGDRIDYNTGAQYFYHCHRENFEQEEHGHFHCFLRYKHIPKSRKPTPIADWDKYIDSPMTHLVAIALNRLGQPIRLFSVNRWISSEIWYDAQDMNAFVQRFKMTKTDSEYWQYLDRWIDGMLHLFSPQIAWLNQQRDQTIKEVARQHPGENVYELESVEELSTIQIDIKQQIEWILA